MSVPLIFLLEKYSIYKDFLQNALNYVSKTLDPSNDLVTAVFKTLEFSIYGYFCFNRKIDFQFICSEDLLSWHCHRLHIFGRGHHKEQSRVS